MLNKIITILLVRFLKYLELHLRNRNNEYVNLGEKSVLYEESRVYNLQKDKLKIDIGINTHIRGELFIWPYGNGISIGNNSFVGKNSTIWAGECITIGNGVLISHNVTIIDSDSHELDFKEREEKFVEMIHKGHPSHKGNVKTAPITIEDNVWISYNVCILKGVTIGKAAIVGAGSVVTKDVLPFTVVAGNPAEVVKYINSY